MPHQIQRALLCYFALCWLTVNCCSKCCPFYKKKILEKPVPFCLDFLFCAILKVSMYKCTEIQDGGLKTRCLRILTIDFFFFKSYGLTSCMPQRLVARVLLQINQSQSGFPFTPCKKPTRSPRLPLVDWPCDCSSRGWLESLTACQ